jgi:peptidoglycan/LPS O-acetylase OafA/YrhL
MSSVTPAGTSSRWRIAGQALTWLAAISALTAAASAISDVTTADHTTLVVQTWRMYGLFLCGGLFVLLALRPQVHGAVWALAILNKAALAITAAAYVTHGGIAEATGTVGWDGALTVVLLTAYLMSRADLTSRAKTAD